MSKEKARQFFDLVRSMREAQKTYFRTRATSALNSALNESRRLEKAVDDEIKNALRIEQESREPKLF